MKAFKATEHENFLKVDFFVPRTANALSLEAARELRALQKQFSKIKKPVIVSSVHPRVFCSGGNLTDYKKLKGKAPGLKVNREIASILNAFAAWPVPKLALIDGDVLGGGMEWLARFDFRWASPNAYFVFWQKRIGLSPGWGGGRAWAAKIGEDNVRRLLLEGQILSAGKAVRESLIDRIVTGWRLQ
jgi:enoyl-CoA hydratase/carnithine racemase